MKNFAIAALCAFVLLGTTISSAEAKHYYGGWGNGWGNSWNRGCGRGHGWNNGWNNGGNWRGPGFYNNNGWRMFQGGNNGWRGHRHHGWW